MAVCRALKHVDHFRVEGDGFAKHGETRRGLLAGRCEAVTPTNQTATSTAFKVATTEHLKMTLGLSSSRRGGKSSKLS